MSRRQNTMIEKTLEKIGIGKAEARVYMTLVENGLIQQSRKFDKKIWRAKSFKTIGNLIQEKINDLSKTSKFFSSLLPALEKQHISDFTIPVLTHFEGVEGMKQLFRDMLLYSDIDTIAFWSMKDAINFLGQEFIEYVSEERVNNRISVRAIWPKGKEVNVKKIPLLKPGKEFLREIRVAPEKLTTSMGYWVYKNKISFISSKKESFGFIVESAELANMLRKQFDVFWKMSKPIT